MHMNEFHMYFRKYVSDRVDQLMQTAEHKMDYMKGKERITPIVEKIKCPENSDDLEFLINAIRASELPIERYCYRQGFIDGIQIAGLLQDLVKR